ncbi:MAG: hypothetical protein KKF46_04090 [Nanoarchaeota archaeon]|nr:hypothetical protein [Nanoarchaeota archaeon]MBU1321515.1 hypothetical protein [Nanoarchaeota archaeon]MBU1597132.1 hypothetical protein [Nanoarchaeota archaeon]MBU2441534.1 hypothetical protein [Nanoarchaeota archaeon]
MVIAPPRRWPRALEDLTSYGSIIIHHAERGDMEKILNEDSYLQNKTHRYKKLFEYLENGYQSIKKASTNTKEAQPVYEGLQSLNQTLLYYNYANIVLQGMLWKGYDTLKFCAHLKYNDSLKTPEDFYEKYFQTAKNTWHNLEKIKPEDKEKIELIKHFNQVTEFISLNKFDEYHELNFNTSKDEWEYGDSDRLIKKY